jgi:hypothetical protein
VNQIQVLMLSDMVAAPLIHQAKQHNVLNPVVKISRGANRRIRDSIDG